MGLWLFLLGLAIGAEDRVPTVKPARQLEFDFPVTPMSPWKSFRRLVFQLMVLVVLAIVTVG